jgi:uncharacterized protein
VILADAGPLVALLDRRDAHHRACLASLDVIPDGDMVTTWPCLTEAMYLLGKGGGLQAQELLWAYLADGLVRVLTPVDGELNRMRGLMMRYRDTPMDLADASLVAAAERLGIRRVFTVDRHFRAYRIEDRHAFEILP